MRHHTGRRLHDPGLGLLTRTRPSWKEYQRHLADERAAAFAAARADELARTQFCEHDRNRTQTCPSCGTVTEDGVPRPALTVFTSDDGWVLISGDGMRRTASAVSDERTDMLILDLFERVFGVTPTRPRQVADET